MNVLIVHAHPEPLSMNGAMTACAVNTLRSLGHAVQVSDLHAMRFQPTMSASDFAEVDSSSFLKYQAEQERAATEGRLAADIVAEIDKCQWADLLILQFPISWFSVPAIMKGWIDRVFVRGIFYGSGKVFDTGGMRGKRAMLSLTTGGMPPVVNERGRFGGIQPLLFHLNYGTLWFVGYDVLDPSVVYGPARIGAEERGRYLGLWSVRLHQVDTELPIPYPCRDEFDEAMQRRSEFAAPLHTMSAPRIGSNR